MRKVRRRMRRKVRRRKRSPGSLEQLMKAETLRIQSPQRGTRSCFVPGAGTARQRRQQRHPRETPGTARGSQCPQFGGCGCGRAETPAVCPLPEPRAPPAATTDVPEPPGVTARLPPGSFLHRIWNCFARPRSGLGSAGCSQLGFNIPEPPGAPQLTPSPVSLPSWKGTVPAMPPPAGSSSCSAPGVPDPPTPESRISPPQQGCREPQKEGGTPGRGKEPPSATRVPRGGGEAGTGVPLSPPRVPGRGAHTLPAGRGNIWQRRSWAQTSGFPWKPGRGKGGKSSQREKLWGAEAGAG